MIDANVPWFQPLLNYVNIQRSLQYELLSTLTDREVLLRIVPPLCVLHVLENILRPHLDSDHVTSAKDYLADVGDMLPVIQGFQTYVLDELESDLTPLTAVNEPVFFERMYQAYSEQSSLFN